MMIAKPLLMEAIEAALNRYLSMDEDVCLFLKPLAGKVIAVNVKPFNWTFYLCPTTEAIQVLEQNQDEPDTTLSGSLAALGMMGLSSKPMRSVFSGKVTIEGDMETGQKFQELFEKLDPDFEESLSHYTGDVIAHKVGRIAHAGQSWGEETIKTFQLNVKEFLQDETRDLPAGPEIEIFYRDVDMLRTGYDRLEARYERLERAFKDSDNKTSLSNKT